MIAELHCHSKSTRLSYFKKYYDSVMSVEQILARCVELGIGILSITDHDSLDGYRKAKKIIKNRKLPIILVPGCEISSKDGHILAYGILEEIPEKLTAEDTIRRIHKQGGLAVAAHPFNSFFSLANKVKKLEVDGLESFCAVSTMLAIKKGMKLAAKLGIPAISGSDAHTLSMIGMGRTIFHRKPRDWRSVLEMIKKRGFGVELTRPRYTSIAIEYIRENTRIRNLEKSLQEN